MPTENRSAQEMVSLPEGYMLVERSIWTEEQVEAATACITRLKGVHGMRDRDIAMAAIDAAQCKAPEITLADLLPAKQHQGEPATPYGWHVEWADSGDHYLFTKVEKRSGALRLDSDVKVVPLYTHADPAEVERLRAEVKRLAHTSVKEEVFDIVCKERDTLRAQLAEAHALLDEAYQHDIGTALKRKMRALYDALSARAEPEVKS